MATFAPCNIFRRIIALALMMWPAYLALGADVELKALWVTDNQVWCVRIEPPDRVGISSNSPALADKKFIEVVDAGTHRPVRFEIKRQSREPKLRFIELVFPELQRPINLLLKVRGLVLEDPNGQVVEYNENVSARAPPAAAGGSAPPPAATAAPHTFYYSTTTTAEPDSVIAELPAEGAAPPPPNMHSRKNAMPEFPFPPPMASAFETVPRELLIGDKRKPILKDVDQALSAAFARCGYGEKSFYAVPDGFAMASRVEQMKADGSPGDERWSLDVTPMRKFSIDAYLNALFRARPGHYRVIIFLVTNHLFEQTDVKVTSEDAGLWVKKGLNQLPKEIGNRNYTDDYNCTALVYEFKRLGSGKATFVEPSEVTGRTHLEKSGLLAALRAVR